jgi:hypothetical protein
MVTWEEAGDASRAKLQGVMGTSKIYPGHRTFVASRKEAHLRWSRRVAWARAFWLFVRILVGLGAWLIQKPIDRDSIILEGVFALAGCAILIGWLMTHRLIPRFAA